MGPEFEEKIKKIFERFDLDQSNSIEKEEVATLFKTYPDDCKDLTNLFDQMDDDGN